jgi:hypothetical protein
MIAAGSDLARRHALAARLIAAARALAAEAALSGPKLDHKGYRRCKMPWRPRGGPTPPPSRRPGPCSSATDPFPRGAVSRGAALGRPPRVTPCQPPEMAPGPRGRPTVAGQRRDSVGSRAKMRESGISRKPLWASRLGVGRRGARARISPAGNGAARPMQWVPSVTVTTVGRRQGQTIDDDSVRGRAGL